MQIFNTIEKTEYSTAVALGFFDGVHKGHQAVIDLCKRVKSDNEKLVVFTFKDSPLACISGKKKPMLTTNEEKFKLFESLGVDIVYCVGFGDVQNMSAEDFVEKVLKNKLNAKTVVTGFNYHFGKGGSADVSALKKLCDDHSIIAHKCEPVMYLDNPISSTRIRACIKNGKIEEANIMLGYTYCISSSVSHGNHIGTKLDSPTINQILNSDLVEPRFGVYATTVTIDNKTFIGATNIGTHPTVGDGTPVCETHLLDFSGGDLYGENANTKLIHFIRPEKKFENLELLKSQIKKDEELILEYFKNHN